MALLWWAATRQIRSEERILAQTRGQPYRHYLGSVPRWFGYRKEQA